MLDYQLIDNHLTRIRLISLSGFVFTRRIYLFAVPNRKPHINGFSKAYLVMHQAFISQCRHYRFVVFR